VLDDSASDREILRRLLVADLRQDYTIHECTSIEETLAACRKMLPDCILLDYSLGDGTGVDFLLELRKLGGTRAFPVVMLTGSGSEDIAAEAFRAGAQDYLPKGAITTEILHRTIKAAIYKAKTERLLDQQRVELERLFHEAQEANARKDQFLAALSHELRTPLTPILAIVSAVDVRDLSPDELEEIFATIRRNVELEARLIDDLLDLTRIAKGKLRLELRSSRAHRLLQHALDTCAEDIRRKHLNLTMSLEAERDSAFADPARLQQIFWNLLKNAVKFTPDHGQIRIVTQNTPEGDLTVEISDTGVGITAEALPRIFTAFEQGDGHANPRYGGLGLGLAISHALVQAHHGQLHASSPGPGQGATFRVTLPTEVAVAKPAPPTDGQGADGVPIPTKAPAKLDRKCNVLLVEDHADSAAVLARILRQTGYEVSVATSSAEAQELFARQEIHVVVSDIGLPDGDGYALLERLRAIREVPGIAISGIGMDRDLARSEAAGFAAHLTKPIHASELREAVAKAVVR
jgi:signal transduction histidine kinase